MCMTYLERVNPSDLWINDRGSDFGDWLSNGESTSKELIGTAFWAYDASIMTNLADALGRSGDADRYRQLAERIREAFYRRYVKADGTVGNGSKTGYVLALHMHLLPRGLEAEAASKLVLAIERKSGHLSMGFLGMAYILPVLSDNGYESLAYELLTDTTSPSWAYTVKHGATTMREQLDGDQRFDDSSMNSFNHYAFGSGGEWLERYLAGIDADVADPGFHNIVVHPTFTANLSALSCVYDFPYVAITSTWKREAGVIAWYVVIPPNTTATISLLLPMASRLSESGRILASAEKDNSAKESDISMVVDIPAGSHDILLVSK